MGRPGATGCVLGFGASVLTTIFLMDYVPGKPPRSTAEVRVVLGCKAAKDGHRIPWRLSWTVP